MGTKQYLAWASDLDTVEDKVNDHTGNSNIHFTATERTKLSGIAEGANKYTHPSSGATAGTYKSVTVNAQGHVTGGSNPTTLAGFGITDAYTISQIDSIESDLNTAINGKADAEHTHPYLSNDTTYALSDSVGGGALKMTVARVTKNITSHAADVPVKTEMVYFCGSDGESLGCPKTYCIINIKKGENHRTLMDCYHIQTGDHYINGCLNTNAVESNPWTGWVLQSNQAQINEVKDYVDTKVYITIDEIDEICAQSLYRQIPNSAGGTTLIIG